MAEQKDLKNLPDMDKIMQTLCELLSRQDGGEYEYTYSLSRRTQANE